MLKTISLLILLSSGFLSAQASDIELFNYNGKAVRESLQNLDKLENEILRNPSLTTELNDLRVDATQQTYGMVAYTDVFGEPPLGIPSFVWGCIFGVAGLIVVMVMTDKDKDEMKHALYGCIVSAAVVVVFYVFVLLSFDNTL